MTPAFRSKLIPTVILAGYVVLPLLGFALWGLPAALVGVLIAYGLDGRHPTWDAELNWREAKKAVRRLCEFRFGKSRFDLLVGHRRVTLLRYTPKQAARVGLLFPLAEWGDLLTPEVEDAFAEHGAGVWYEGVVDGEAALFAQASTEGDREAACVRMLRHALELAHAEHEADVQTRPRVCPSDGGQVAEGAAVRAQ